MGRSWTEIWAVRTSLVGSESHLTKILSPSDRMPTSFMKWASGQPVHHHSREKKRKRRKTQKKQKGRSREPCTPHRLTHIWHTAPCTHSLVTSPSNFKPDLYITSKNQKATASAIRAAQLHAKLFWLVGLWPTKESLLSSPAWTKLTVIVVRKTICGPGCPLVRS